MAKYHVGCGVFGIYAGTLESRNKTLWRNKSDVTDEAICAVAQYLLFQDKSFIFQHKNKLYAMRIEEMEGEKE